VICAKVKAIRIPRFDSVLIIFPTEFKRPPCKLLQDEDGFAMSDAYVFELCMEIKLLSLPCPTTNYA
jgi:hypothetical protein